jgi:hypothetical protein
MRIGANMKIKLYSSKSEFVKIAGIVCMAIGIIASLVLSILKIHNLDIPMFCLAAFGFLLVTISMVMRRE